jgi:hypothetical protein
MKWILLLLVIAGVAGYFTKPDEAVMRERADAVLSDPQNISQGFESLGATIAGERAFSNYYVASKYTVTLDGSPQAQQQTQAAERQAGLSLDSVVDYVTGMIAGQGRYENYYVMSKYTVDMPGASYLECYGAFTMVRCSDASARETS